MIAVSVAPGTTPLLQFDAVFHWSDVPPVQACWTPYTCSVPPQGSLSNVNPFWA
jgi:hypothetical protein